MEENNLAIITARGGSKRIPRKNIKDFLGFPIIRYSIDAARESGCFNEIMVSTDDKEIAEIARKYGAEVPFFRSSQTSHDMAMTAEVVEEVLLEYRNLNRLFTHCCCIYPTAPLISPSRIREGFEILKLANADSAVPVVQFSYPILRALKIENNLLSMIWPENLNRRSQDLSPAFHDAGQFYWINVNSFLQQKTLFSRSTVPIIVPESEVQDIDNEEDWKIAEIKYRVLKGIKYDG